MGTDAQSEQSILRVDYMTKSQVVDLLGKVLEITKVCKAQMKVYESVQTAQSQMQSGVKSYIKWLISQTRKVSMTESFVEQIYLKATLADKVYLTSMMDLHDYTRQTLVVALQYASACVKKS